MTKILAIETASPPGSIALLDGSNTIGMTQLSSPVKTTQQFALSIQELLAAANWASSDIELLAAHSGPGSFTGLRIGITAAKTFAFAIGCRVAAINTLTTIASQASPLHEGQEIEAVLDAQRNQLFAARFRYDPSGLREIHATEIFDAADWLATRAAGAKLIGTGLKKHHDKLAVSADVAEPAQWVPTAESLGRLAMQAANDGKTLSPLEMNPRYFRKSAAEEKLGGP